MSDLLRGYTGCPFASRCSSAMQQCRELPPSFDLGYQRAVKCWLVEEAAQVKQPV